MSQEASGINKWTDFIGCPSEVPIPLTRFQNAALLRLVLAVPFTMAPTGYLLKLRGFNAWELTWAQGLWQTHFAATLIYCFVAVFMLVLSTKNTLGRRKLLTALNLIAVLCEVVTAETELLAHGSLIYFGVAFYPLLIGLYRALFGYFTALFVLLVSMAVFVGGAMAELNGWFPLTPLMSEPSAHSLWQDPLQWGNVLVSVPLICFLTFGVVNYASNQHARLHDYLTRAVLQRYLPPTLVDKAATGALSLDTPAQRTELTVMFTDIVGFTALSEKISPEKLGDLLGKLLGEVADLAMSHGATVDKFIGDCVMVVFGAPEPLPTEDQAKRCVNLALAIHERIKNVGAAFDLHARTGINTGEVVVGNFGSMARSDYTVLGTTVNIAARLESISEPDCILIGSRTAEFTRAHFDLEPAGALELKGVSRTVEGYFVIGKKRT